MACFNQFTHLDTDKKEDFPGTHEKKIYKTHQKRKENGHI